MKTLTKYIILFLIGLCACSPQGGGLVSNGYHDLTAHYNAYFIANELIKEIESTIYNNYEWNYNKILPIYPQFDTTDAASLKTQIDDCIEKASIAITRHGNSRWEDDSYLLVGKARFYSLEFQDAIETFKYVNKNSKNDNTRHEALIELFKTFIEANEFNNAIVVSDYLKKEELNNTNLKALHQARAYFHQKRNDYNEMVKNLVKAEELMSSTDRARIEFIIGQIYQHLGFEAEAYHYYENVLRNRPDYELSFYTKLNMAQVTQLTNDSDIRKVRKYFRKLLKDPKNAEYKDKIYYEMGGFELKQGNLEEAIEFYKLSVSNSVKNIRQKAYSYLKLGQIYYDSLRNFELAQAYYDSTVNSMPADEENFEKIKQRAEILDDFILQINTIKVNDSLLILAELPQDSVTALLKQAVENDMKREEEKKKEEERRAARQVTAFDTNEGSLIGTNLSGATWYFYNPSAVSRGSSDFKRRWGNRPLEDNWRRRNKSSSEIEVSEDPGGIVVEPPEEGESEEGSQLDSRVASLLETVPFDQESKNKLLVEIETAYYNLGNIYNFKLEEKENAIVTFEQLISRFDTTHYKAEVLYQLYLLYKNINQKLSSEKANQLKNEFPESIYAKLIDNPNYREESNALTAKLQKVYNKAYKLYDQGMYKEAYQITDSVLYLHPENGFSDNLKLLQILCTGVIDGQYKYQYELNNFLKTYSESELLPYAEKLVKASEDYQINLYSSSKGKYIEHFDQKHYVVIIYPSKPQLSQEVPREVESFIKEKNFKLTTGNLVLDENHAMVLINDFPGRGSAIKFLEIILNDLLLSDKHKGEKFDHIAISQDNFDIFYKTKDLTSYLNFFEKHYQQ